MSVISSHYEKDVAEYINDSVSGFYAERPTTHHGHSDIRISYKDLSNIWIEVKMNTSDNLINPRLDYINGKWSVSDTYKSAATDFLLPYLNECPAAKKWIRDLKKFAGVNKLSLYSTKRDRVLDKNSLPINILKSFLASKPNKNICIIDNVPASNITTLHYLHAKNERTNYISLGDNFYKLGRANPLGIIDLKQFKSDGVLTIRISESSTRDSYEIQTTLKIKGSLNPSNYSIMPGSEKTNPFHNMKHRE